MAEISREDYNDGYCHSGKDLEDYPDAWLDDIVECLIEIEKIVKE